MRPKVDTYLKKRLKELLSDVSDIYIKMLTHKVLKGLDDCEQLIIRVYDFNQIRLIQAQEQQNRDTSIFFAHVPRPITNLQEHSNNKRGPPIQKEEEIVKQAKTYKCDFCPLDFKTGQGKGGHTQKIHLDATRLRKQVKKQQTRAQREEQELEIDCEQTQQLSSQNRRIDQQQ